MAQLLDLDDLIVSCRDSYARTLFQEAVGCYRIGSYRACVVSAWVAVCFDLFRKFRELSRLGDERAAELVRQIDTYLEQMRSGNEQGLKSALDFERTIISKSVGAEVIDDGAALDLRRLQEDRNRCAHPNFERFELPLTITAEQARVHLRSAVMHVLGEAPVQGRAALAQLRSLITSMTLPTSRLALERVIRASPLRRASDALVRGFVDTLIYEQIEDTPGWSKHLSSTLLSITMEMHPAKAEERLRQQIVKVLGSQLGDRFEAIAYLALSLPQAWSAVGDGEKARIGASIEQAPFERIRDLIKISADRHTWQVMNRLETLNNQELKWLVQAGMRHRTLTREAAKRYRHCANWSVANEISQHLIVPLAQTLTAEQVTEIIKAAGSGTSDLAGSHGFPQFLNAVVQSKVLSKSDIQYNLIENKLEHLVELVAEPSDLDDDIPF